MWMSVWVQLFFCWFKRHKYKVPWSAIHLIDLPESNALNLGSRVLFFRNFSHKFINPVMIRKPRTENHGLGAGWTGSIWKKWMVYAWKCPKTFGIFPGPFIVKVITSSWPMPCQSLSGEWTGHTKTHLHTHYILILIYITMIEGGKPSARTSKRGQFKPSS